MTERFKVVARALERAVTPDVILDGEVCALDDEGRAASRSCSRARARSSSTSSTCSKSTASPSSTSAARAARAPRGSRRLQGSDQALAGLRRRRGALFEAAKEQGLEGIVSKKVESRYQPGKRTREWLKVKATGRQEFLVAGYTQGQGRRAGRFGSLVLAVREGKELEYVGNVGGGFTEDEIDRLLAQLRPLERDTPPFREVPKIPRVRKGDIVWVEAPTGRRGEVRRVDATGACAPAARSPRTKRRPTCIARNRSPARSARASGR